MVESMSELARQQKLASAKKKLKRFQKAKSPTNGQIPPNSELDKEILRGIQNNHIFKTPPLTVSNKQTTPSTRDTKSNHNEINHKLNFSNLENSPLIGVQRSASPSPANGLSPFIGAPDQNHFSNGKDGKHSVNGVDVKGNNIEKNEELEQCITSYKRANEQLGNQVQEQRKQIIQLQERLKKDGESSQKLTEQRALKEQLEVHIQTIGILVSEKSELQSNVAKIQKKLNTKETELVEINGQLQTLRQHAVDLEKNISLHQNATEQLNQVNKGLVNERDRISSKLYDTSHEKDDVNLQNSELHAKLQVKVEECVLLLNQVNDLHNRLQKGELMIQQLSTNSIDPQAIANWHNEKEELIHTIEEQRNIVHKLVSDKAELLEKHNDTQSHYDIQIEQLKNKINLLEDERYSLLEKSKSLSESLVSVQDQLAAQSVVETSKANIEQNIGISNAQYETIKTEKISLERELDIQINENRRLARVVLEQSTKIEEIESTLSRLNAESSDKTSLLDQIQSDKETISRALQQNKLLKEQLQELECGFVKMSNSSADLTSKLESEQHGNKDVASKLSEIQIELEETKLQLHNKSSTCDQLSDELQRFKTEVESVQTKMISQDMDLDLLNTELETVQHELSLNELKSTHESNSLDLTGKLQNELRSAQDTINELSHENTQLKEAIHEIQSSSSDNLDGSLYPGRQIDAKHFSQSPPPHYGDETSEELNEEELHAKSWEELEDDEDYEDRDPLSFTNEQVDQMQVSLQLLQSEREKILYLLQDEREKAFKATESIEEHVELQVQQQLKQCERELQEHFFEQTEALHNKVQSLQEALEIMRKNEDIADFDMTSDGITMPLLKTAFMQLQKRYKSAMDARAQLSDRIEQLEHVNMKLETETETIGEYIALYQTQRQALKAKFSEKDQIITQLSNEHGRMQTKVSQLHQLVMQMLSDRSGIESKNKQLQELVNRRLALQTGAESIDPEVPKLQFNLDNLFGQMTLTPDEENELVDNITVDESMHRDSVTNDQTTQQILQIFEQLETTGEGYQHGWLSPAARKHDFHPCKNCIGSPIYL